MILLEKAAELSNLVVAAAAAVGAFTAWRGLNTWRDQNRWQVDHELARRALIATYRYRNAIESVRNRSISKLEMMPEKPLHGASWLTLDGNRLAIERRWKRVGDVRVEIESILIEAEALWGDRLAWNFKKIFEIEKTLLQASRAFLRSIDESIGKDEKSQALAQVKELGNIHFESQPMEEDSFKIDFEDRIQAIEKYLKELMEGGRK